MKANTQLGKKVGGLVGKFFEPSSSRHEKSAMPGIFLCLSEK
jgi:hypothetical protein